MTDEQVPEKLAAEMTKQMVDAIIDANIAFLNGLVKLDRDAIEKLVEYRVPCNDALANHPTVQAVMDNEARDTPHVGMLGIINGMFGVQPKGAKHPGWGYIAAVYDDAIRLVGFKRIDK